MTTALVLYMPVVHKGYLNFINREKYDAVFLIENSLAIELLDNLRKDLRALPVLDVCRLLVGLDRGFAVYIATSQMQDILHDFDVFIMPDEDISHIFAERFLQSKMVIFRDVFLRYDKKRTTEPFVPNPDEVVTTDQFARDMIARCDELAQKSPDWWRQIGGVIVKDDKVVEELQMFNEAKPFGMAPYELGDPRSNFKKGLNPELTLVLHVEQGLVSRAARLGIALEGADLYVSTFPCPWCATAVAYSGIRRVYYRDGYAMLDGEDILKSNGVELIRVVET